MRQSLLHKRQPYNIFLLPKGQSRRPNLIPIIQMKHSVGGVKKKEMDNREGSHLSLFQELKIHHPLKETKVQNMFLQSDRIITMQNTIFQEAHLI